MPKKKIEYTWIESRKKYRKRIKIGDKWRDVYGIDEKEIKSKIRELEKAHDNGIVLDNSTTLIQYAREWFPVKAAGLAPKSAHIYKNAINNHIAPFFGNLKITEVKPLHVQKLMASKADLANSTQSKILFTLSQIMDSAENNGLIIKNPCKGIKPSGAPYKKKTPLSQKQQIELVNAVKGTRAELFVLLCLYAGLRREEALGLTWGNVHFDSAPYIEVRNTVTFDKNQPIHSTKLKSKAAYRTIPIPTALKSALCEARTTSNSTLVITAQKSGGAMSLTAFRRMWNIVTGYTHTKKNANGKTTKYSVQGIVDFHVEPHQLRHTYITELCASGLDIKKIQYLAGHEDVNMTLKVYAHVKNSNPAELHGTIDKIFSGVKPGVKRFKAKKIP